jgi:hypothetical protein
VFSFACMSVISGESEYITCLASWRFTTWGADLVEQKSLQCSRSAVGQQALSRRRNCLTCSPCLRFGVFDDQLPTVSCSFSWACCLAASVEPHSVENALFLSRSLSFSSLSRSLLSLSLSLSLVSFFSLSLLSLFLSLALSSLWE